jgi:hypothetical protein
MGHFTITGVSPREVSLLRDLARGARDATRSGGVIPSHALGGTTDEYAALVELLGEASIQAARHWQSCKNPDCRGCV